MSQWTHFLGTVQCCGTEEEVEKAFGKPVLWNDISKLGYQCGTPEYDDYYKNVWYQAFKDFRLGRGIPMGSEGSVKWKFSDTHNIDYDDGEDYTAMGEGSLIAIEGDLRDFGDEDDIQKSIDWFVKGCNAIRARLATLYINAEWGDIILIEFTWGEVSKHVLRARKEG